MGARLRLGPVLRHAGETTATIWVETDAPCRVTVTAADRTAEAATFTVHGHHYAVCDITELAPGTVAPYTVSLDGEQVWPEPADGRPPSLLRTLDPAAAPRIVFGSCRTPAGHGPAEVRRFGVDMLRAYALRLAARRTDDAAPDEPTVLLLTGDQVYADELQPPMMDFLRERRRPTEGSEAPPADEVVFFDEYAELYRQAWSDPDIRWLLSTVPTLMLFDDHDIRDDWNSSGAWRREMAVRPWWRPRVTSGLGAYWVYQHVGNLSPAERAADPVHRAIAAAESEAADAPASPDSGGRALDDFAWRAHTDPASYRWSHRHDLGRTRVVMVDTRCGREVDDESRRSMLGGPGAAWLDEQLTGDVDHLVLACTIPFLLPGGVHHLEAWNEAVCAGAWGGWARGPAERLRQALDLEHWPAFQRSFRDVTAAVLEVAVGRRGTPPASVLLLGGDVHFSYLARARGRGAAASTASPTRIAQLVCSPIRNPLAPRLRAAMGLASKRLMSLACRVAARTAGVRGPALSWRVDDGLWFDNSLATLVLDGRTAEVTWEHAPGDDHEVRELARHRIAE
ncbi:alkaline phosphatase D family protein [Marinactinospora rubrisoli]|uniref:Alkaline phosphatase D family protein n=1 Tax=Marinactinospora rubrisoli TaxID=2715399 RepID=A0ABW2KMI3_9ACTN